MRTSGHGASVLSSSGPSSVARVVAVGDGDKINIHQPLSTAGNIPAAGQHHHISFRPRRALVINVFQHFGESDLGLRIALLKLAQNGE